MSYEAFDALLGKVRSRLEKRSRRDSISPEERLVVTLRYLATGNTFRSLAIDFFMGYCTVGNIVRETCDAIVAELHEQYVRTPQTADEWRAIAEGFYQRWDMPNCLGAIDGKHCQMRKPANSGSLYYNYKGTFSTLMLAVTDYQHKFIWVWIGNYGHESDAGLFDRSDFGRLVNQGDNPLNLPEPGRLPDTDEVLPFFFIGDGAFPLQEHIMKPFGQNALSEERRIFNYRLSRARRVVESAFGILSARWRVFLKPMEAAVKNTDNIIRATVCLHNFLIDISDAYYPVGDAQLPAANEQLLQPRIRRRNANRAPSNAEVIRNKLVAYFSGEGAVAFQDDMIAVA